MMVVGILDAQAEAYRQARLAHGVGFIAIETESAGRRREAFGLIATLRGSEDETAIGDRESTRGAVIKDIKHRTRRAHGPEEKIAREATSGEVRNLRQEAAALKEAVAGLTLENRLLKMHDRGWGDEE